MCVAYGWSFIKAKIKNTIRLRYEVFLVNIQINILVIMDKSISVVLWFLVITHQTHQELVSSEADQGCAYPNIIQNLRILNLSYTRIENYSSRSFTCMPHLNELLLNNNQITELQGFGPLTNLTRLDLSENSLRVVSICLK